MSAHVSAASVVHALSAVGATVGTAESLTGGLLGAALTSVAGSSTVYRGGIVAYATDLKVQLLGVDPGLVARHGVVSAACAEAMAVGARTRTGATYGLSATGVAGPDSQDDQPPGTVYVGLCGPHGTSARALSLAGDRDAVRRGAVAAALSVLSEQLAVSGCRRVGEETGLG